MAEWWVRLTGEGFDLKELPNLFHSSNLGVTGENGSYFLISSEFNSFTDASQVHTRAKELLDLLNGAARVKFSNFRPVAIDVITEIKEDGSRHNYVSLSGTVTMRSRVTGTLTVIKSDGTTKSSSQPPEPESWIDLASCDQNVADALKLMASDEHSWGDLYMVFEVVKRDVGGENRIVKTAWATKSKIQLFRQTAQASRHAPGQFQPPKKPMSLSEARSFISGLVDQWLRSKGH